MITLLLVSSCVSLITLGALLFHRRKAKPLAIPSWFMGQKDWSWEKLQKRRPPWATWFLVGLFTFSAAMVFYPWQPPKAPGATAVALVWLDRSLEAFGAWATLSADEKEDFVSSWWAHLVGGGQLLEDSVSPGWARHGPHVAYALRPIRSPKEIVAHWDALMPQGPLPWPQPLDMEKIKTALTGLAPRGDAEVFVVTVPPSGAVAQWESLGSGVGAWHPLYIPQPRPLLPSTPVAPGSLLKAWGKAGALVAPQAGAIDDNQWWPIGAEGPPTQALPGVVRIPMGPWTHYGPQRRAQGTTLVPMVFRCDTTAGPGELDPGADLQALAHFFSIPTFPCPQGGPGGLKPLVENGLWAFRGPGLVVRPWPEVSSGRHQWPTSPSRDTTVWVPPREALAQAPLVPVPLDPGHNPVLMPLPDFPQEVPSGAKTLWQAGPVLALGLPSGDAILRTPLALPGSPLSRSPAWATFWLSFAQPNPKLGGGALQHLSLKSPQTPWPSGVTLAQWVGPQGQLAPLPTQPVPGLYLSAQGQWVLWTVDSQSLGPPPKAPSQVLGKARLLGPLPEGADGGTPHPPWPQWVALGVALTCLGLLWVRWPRREWAAALLALVGSWGWPGRAHAQEGGGLPWFFKNFGRTRTPTLPRPATLGVKVGWCGTSVPPPVAQKWAAMAQRLAQLGTIDLPDNLVPEGCKPGKTHVWWAPTPKDIPWDTVEAHTRLGGAFVVEAFDPKTLASGPWAQLQNPSLGQVWEYPYRKGPLLRSFFLMSSFDGCPQPATAVLLVRRGPGAETPLGVATGGRLIGQGAGCGSWDGLMLEEAFTNLWYFLLTTNYKQEQMQLPELLNRVRNLGLEP